MEHARIIELVSYFITLPCILSLKAVSLRGFMLFGSTLVFIV